MSECEDNHRVNVRALTLPVAGSRHLDRELPSLGLCRGMDADDAD